MLESIYCTKHDKFELSYPLVLILLLYNAELIFLDN